MSLALQGQHRSHPEGITSTVGLPCVMRERVRFAGYGIRQVSEYEDGLADFSGNHIPFPADLACDETTVSAVIIDVYTGLPDWMELHRASVAFLEVWCARGAEWTLDRPKPSHHT
eukprot:scpid60160/ scgid20371/ 